MSDLVATVSLVHPWNFLTFDGTGFSVEHHVLDIDLGTLEPLFRRHDPPDQNTQHRRTIYQTSPVH